MPTVSLTLPVSGTVITAGLLATDLTTLQTLLNGGLDNNNIAVGANIDPLKLASGWQAYVPVWTSGGTAPVINNGTLTGRWTQIGKTVVFWASMTAGSGTTFGSANPWTISLPTAAFASHPLIGTALAIDTGLANYMGEFFKVTTTTVNMATINAASGTLVGWDSTHPFAWGNTDVFSISGMYEAA